MRENEKGVVAVLNNGEGDARVGDAYNIVVSGEVKYDGPTLSDGRHATFGSIALDASSQRG
jgi:hypothetical protein